jgi:hypothetical protein
MGPVSSGLMSSFGPLMAKFLQPKKAMKIEEIPSLVRKDAKRVRMTYGPFKLKGREVGHVHNCIQQLTY